MKIIKLTYKNQNDVLTQALTVLKNSGVVVTPSETQYGLSTDPINTNAVAKLLTIKNRGNTMPLGLVAGSHTVIENFFLLNEQERRISQALWPGPLGLNLQPKNHEFIHILLKNTLRDMYDGANVQQNKKIIRITSNAILAELSNRLDRPLISTSANVSGQPACYDIESVIEQLNNNEVKPDLIIDAGVLPEIPPSTMLDLTGDTPIIIRKGADFEVMEKILKEVMHR